MPEHTCQLPTTCLCRVDASEPYWHCPVHGEREFPPRCELCGQYMRIPHNMFDDQTKNRFMSNVMKRTTSGCWFWMGNRTKGDYGRFSVGGRLDRMRYRAHRYAWMMTYGPIPDGMDVMHKCDQPSCVNPEHLELGNHKKNMKT